MARRKRTTPKQLAANRANAQRSTGPRTPEGKAAVRYNALTHGVLARAVLPEPLERYESRADFDALLERLHAELRPVGALESLLVEQIAVAYWRLARLYRAEAGAIARRQEPPPSPNARLDAAADRLGAILEMEAAAVTASLVTPSAALEAACADPSFDQVGLLRDLLSLRDPAYAQATEEELIAAAHREADRIRAEKARRAEEDAQAEAQAAARRRAIAGAYHSLPAPDEALKFARYETSVQNQLDRALARLERLQRLRGGERVPPPLQVEVDVVATPPPPDP